MSITADTFKWLLESERRFIENLFTVVDKQRRTVPFRYNTIQALADEEETGMDVWLKPSQVGFSTERIAKRVTNTLTVPGTNTILVAYEDFITERLLNKVTGFYNHLESLGIPGFPEIKHNCLPYHTKIQLADGSYKSIGSIVNQKQSVAVKSCNLGTGEIEPKMVVNWYKYPSNHQWIVLGSGYKFSHMMTSNHPIWVGTGWKLARDVEIGDTTYHAGFVPNDDQKQVILGTMLGDGHHDASGGLCVGQASLEYAKFKWNILREHSTNIISGLNFGYGEGKLFHTFRLAASPLFDEYRLPDLDARGLAIWYCDDGSLGKTNTGYNVTIHTECFTDTFHELIVDQLWNKFNIKAKVSNHREYKVIHICDWRKFFSVIACYIPHCMEYKVPVGYSCGGYEWNTKFNSGLVPYNVGIKSIALTEDRIYNYVYNIEVEDNHNYFTSAGLCKNSTYEKTFQFKVDGSIVGESSIYIASSRSKTAGRAETIHHALFDEPAFYVPQAVENIIAPALARIPPEGTCDVFSTPNGEENWFHDTYEAAKNGQNEFTAHFFPWWLHLEYQIGMDDPRLRMLPEINKPEFKLQTDEERLMHLHGLSWKQIRWRRWMNKRMDSLRRKGELRTLFSQEFPEDDTSCFLATGDMYYQEEAIDRLYASCYDAPIKWESTHVWYPPEEGWYYLVVIDPSQAKFTQSAITVLGFKRLPESNNIQVKWCARDSGWHETEKEYEIACRLSDKYGRALMVWEANGHGLAFTLLAKNRRPIYFRTDLIDGIPTQMPGWYTSGGKGGTKDYMMGLVRREISDLICHDRELVTQLTNFRTIDGKLEIVGMDDVHDTLAIGLAAHNPNPPKRGKIGQTGYNQSWGRRRHPSKRGRK